MLTFYSSVAWALQNELNAWDVSKMTLDEIAEHHNLVDHFTINLDELSMGANEGGYISWAHKADTNTKRMLRTAVNQSALFVLVLQPMWMGLAFILQRAERLNWIHSRSLIHITKFQKDLV